MEQVALTLGISFDKDVIHFNIKRIINQVYKLLPTREEGKEWQKPLSTLIEQLAGMKRLIIGQDDLFFVVLCKLEGLFSLKDEEDMFTYRRIIFECLGILNNLDRNVCS